MQIVINIGDDVYKRALVYKDVQLASNKANDLSELITAVANGTPLPKNHGRLIDASQLLTVTECREDGTEYCYVPYTHIEDAPTIIEADKGSEVKDKTTKKCREDGMNNEYKNRTMEKDSCERQ